MSFPVFIARDNGHYVATLLGAPKMRVSAATREEALAEIQVLLQKRIAHGELVFVDPPPLGLLALAGKYRDDPTLTEIRDEIYRARDAEPRE